VLLTAGALGALAGTLVGSRVASAVGLRTALAGAVALQGATLFAIASARSVPLVAALWFANGLPAGWQRPVARSLQQRLTPNHLLGRVNVTARIFTRGVIVPASLAAGGVAAIAGVRAALAAGAVVQLVAAAAMWRVLAARPDADGRAGASTAVSPR